MIDRNEDGLLPSPAVLLIVSACERNPDRKKIIYFVSAKQTLEPIQTVVTCLQSKSASCVFDIRNLEA